MGLPEPEEAVKDIFCVRLDKHVEVAPAPHFGSKSTGCLYVVASSFALAVEAVGRRYPQAKVRGVECLNWSGVPIILGD
jgi:hypothetical protein